MSRPKVDYYTQGNIEFQDYAIAKGWAKGLNRANIVKYVTRAGEKNKETELQDLQKAKDYLDFEIERVLLEKGGKEVVFKSEMDTLDAEDYKE